MAWALNEYRNALKTATMQLLRHIAFFAGELQV